MNQLRRHITAVALSITLLAATGVHAQDRGTGIGLIAGEPSGLSIKQWFNDIYAMDMALAWSFDRNASVQLHGNLLAHDYGIVNLTPGRWPIYVGLGARVKFDDERRRGNKKETNTRVGVRLPIGMAHLVEGYPVDVFVEAVPVLDVAPATSFTINGAIGIRYFFD